MVTEFKFLNSNPEAWVSTPAPLRKRAPGAQGLGLGFRGLGFRGLGFRGLGFRGLGFRGLGFRGLGFRGLGFSV